jgi:hypothetical protein
MARRVSLKGKGADLFFGDYPPGGDEPAPSSEASTSAIPADTVIPPTVVMPEVASATETTETDTPPLEPPSTTSTPSSEDGHPAKRSRPRAEPSEPPIAVAAELLGAELIDTMWERLASQASISNSFRYTEHELDELKDVLYHVSKDERVRLTKQDIARLGLNAVLWDYRRRGDASLLSEFARRKRRPQEG